jgi:Flp pilus assembly protein TadD
VYHLQQNGTSLTAVMKVSRRLDCLLLLVLTTAIAAPNSSVQDASIDKLLNKLPPPEKLVDPAMNDSLAKQMTAAIKAQNFGTAVDLSRRLSERYPKSLGAHMMHGMLALSLRRFPESSVAYHKALSIRPNFAAAYLGLGLSEASQNHFANALAHFQRVTRLEPKAEVGWICSSACAEKMGRRRDSLQYARQATTVAPSSPGAWFQLAREEGISGNNQAAANALARANQLRKNVKSAVKRG